MFRFLIRDVLWLTVVVGLALGWWIEHRRIGAAPGQLRTLVSILNQQGMRVDFEPHSVHVVAPNFNTIQDLGFPLLTTAVEDSE